MLIKYLSCRLFSIQSLAGEVDDPQVEQLLSKELSQLGEAAKSVRLFFNFIDEYS